MYARPFVGVDKSKLITQGFADNPKRRANRTFSLTIERKNMMFFFSKELVQRMFSVQILDAMRAIAVVITMEFLALARMKQKGLKP